jgi:hypothetical protein
MGLSHSPPARVVILPLLIKYYFMHLSKPCSFFLLHPSNARLDQYQDLAMARYEELLEIDDSWTMFAECFN